MAQDEPDIDVIAVEIYRRGLAQLLCAIDREQVGNIRLIRGNAIDVLDRLIAPGSLTGVRVFFPDPWPKARHHKRRFLQPATIGLIADRLLPGGVLHAATDHPGYAEHIAEVGDAEPRLCRVDPGSRRCRSRSSAPPPSTRRRPKKRAAPSTELIWKRLEGDDHEPDRRGDSSMQNRCDSPAVLSAEGLSSFAAAGRPRPAGVGRPQPRHGPGLHPGPSPDGPGTPPFRRARPLAAGTHRRGQLRHVRAS